MSKLILNTECNLYSFNGTAVYGSRQVATEFDKRHDRVLRSFDEMTDPKNGVSEEMMKVLAGQTIDEFVKENYFESKYKDASGKWNREVLMTQKGAMLIVMGFTGGKATAIKIGLLNRFEAMADFIKSLNAARLEHPAFTDAIQASIEAAGKELAFHYFTNEADMINRIVIGASAKKFREANNLAKSQSIRPYLTIEQIKAIEALQRADIGLLLAGLEYEQRKQTLIALLKRMQLKRIA